MFDGVFTQSSPLSIKLHDFLHHLPLARSIYQMSVRVYSTMQGIISRALAPLAPLLLIKCINLACQICLPD